MEANSAHTERIKRRRQEGSLAIEPTSPSVTIDDNETQYEDIVRVLEKRKSYVGNERVKLKGTQKKRARTSPTKKKQLTKQKYSKRKERVPKTMDEQPKRDLIPKFKSKGKKKS